MNQISVWVQNDEIPQSTKVVSSKFDAKVRPQLCTGNRRITLSFKETVPVSTCSSS
jgi:hypothetical protein